MTTPSSTAVSGRPEVRRSRRQADGRRSLRRARVVICGNGVDTGLLNSLRRGASTRPL